MSLLTETEVRVLGSLIEKQITTPEYYPLTLNSLTAACNQKNNRNPVTALSESEVDEALYMSKKSGRNRVTVRQVTRDASPSPGPGCGP